jgi:hypothetical protein
MGTRNPVESSPSRDPVKSPATRCAIRTRSAASLIGQCQVRTISVDEYHYIGRQYEKQLRATWPGPHFHAGS